MKAVVNLIAVSDEIARALATADTIVAPTPINPFLIAAKAQENSLLVVTATGRSSEDLVVELSALHERVWEFPAWETLPHERLSPRGDTVAHRISTLHKVRTSTEPFIVVTSVRALIHQIIGDLAATGPLMLSVGDECELSNLVKQLSELAYVRTDLVERRGEFAVRGGIIDIFLPLAQHPIRIDFFGDTIESIHQFEISDQRRHPEIIPRIEIFPCRELLLTDEIRSKAHSLKDQYPGASEMLERISQGIVTEGMESLIPLLVDNQKLILDLLPKSCEIIYLDLPRITSRTSDLLTTNEEFFIAAWSNAAVGASAPIALPESAGKTYLTWSEFENEVHALKFAATAINPFGSDLDPGTVFLDCEAIEPMRGDSEKLIALFRAEGGRKNRYFTAFGNGISERYRDLLRDAEINEVQSHTAPFAHGFILPSADLVYVTERDVTGSKSNYKDGDRLPSRRKSSIDPLELKSGDYIVHEQHGIGRYQKMITRTIGGFAREYLVIEYAPSKRGQPGDQIFVPSDALDQISKYIGGESPAVHRIGSGEWQKAKGRARKAVRQIAGELIRLYAARRSSPGFAFSPDTPWQAELEDAFAYVETADQLATINEVKRDMEAPYPMDRIICGDVGYGKTEIAIRAAFKAVQDGKQVAVLVPTTLLVQQHSKTFAERFAGFPIRVDGLSRFNSAKESKEIIAALSAGQVDVVIGTHRILSQDVAFKDLGLVIVDEEQRFGVEQKESLKKLRTTVDVLAMSATPIPRTLEMAITGIREMSTITTPPEERHPILTYVGASENAQIAAAIHRELLRDGQIFYLHNRVETIEATALRLKELVPEARIRIAHGQMPESALEDVILGFWNRDFDILVCTTIVESGLDIANANTLIVERADLFGLSQLHQLRGRVGRGRERAYAYFLYPADQPLSEVSLDRLKTIASNTDLGSGMRVALKDLEIRGAGNLLGGEQIWPHCRCWF
jgi:transcription-repair coupling factor (superfamily II helicase)